MSKGEILLAIKDMNNSKSSGIDGLPVEFYRKFWKFIKNEISEIIINMIKREHLKENQRKAILISIHKDGEINQLKNRRPISLNCTNVHIDAKILARRLKVVMDSYLKKSILGTE